MQMGRLREIDSQGLILEIVDHLPNYIKTQWKKDAIKTKRNTDEYPEISDPMNFVSKRADKARDLIYGQYADFKQSETVNKQVFAINTKGAAKPATPNREHTVNKFSFMFYVQ